MSDLYLHGRPLRSIFELLGTKEDNITYSIGWALSQCPGFLQAVLSKVFGRNIDASEASVFLQRHSKKGGFTDIEVHTPQCSVIVEAKRGTDLPSVTQLQLYAKRLEDNARRFKSLVVMAESIPEYADLNLRKSVSGYPVAYLSWKNIAALCDSASGGRVEKRLLRQLKTYLERIVKMQNQETNWVYVVSLSYKRPDWSKLTWIEMVEKSGRYFSPVGKGWPKEPVNYLGFRYDGRLQSIRHVESWKIVDEKGINAEMPELTPEEKWIPHYIYTLGPPIIPSKTVKNGKVRWAARAWAMLDLLLTCDTISEARDLSHKRVEEIS